MTNRRAARARTRTFRCVVARVVAPRIAAFAVLAATVGLGQVMAMHPSAQPSDQGSAGVPGRHPSWRPEDAAKYPGCVPSYAWPAGQVASSLVVYRYRDRTRLRVAFAAAWSANHNRTEADDVWVIGVCR